MVPRPRKCSNEELDENTKQIPEDSFEKPAAKELLYEGYFYDVTEWVKRHPGGKVIEFYTQSGEDATIAIKQFHQRSTKKVMSIMNTLKKRPATENEIGWISPRHKALTSDFMKLYKEFLDEGLFKPSWFHLTYRLSELAAFAIVGFYFINSPDFLQMLFGMGCISLFLGRTGWIQHEGGHHSLTGVPKVDRFIQTFVWGIGTGLGGSWWVSQHNRHHAMPQRLHRDVDLETLPLIAFNVKAVKNPKDGKSFFIKYQSILFLAVDTAIVAFLWKLFLHPRHAFRKGYYVELTCMALHYVMPFYMGFIKYVICIWAAATYLLGNFSLSHTHMPVTKDSLHWVEYSFLHTTNVNSSWWCDWWMGFLNYQIEHHLFPTMPEFRGPMVAPRVKEFARKHGIPYNCVSYSEAMVKSFSNLHNVAKELNKD